jgi:ankyrin repeat protein
MPENRDIERRKSDEIERRTDSLVQRSLDYLKEFDEQGLANVEEPDMDGWDLHHVARENRVDIALALIARGDDVEAKDNVGYTPLHYAIAENSRDVARLLIDRGADIEALGVARLLIEQLGNTDGIDLSWMDDQKTPPIFIG